jgi:prepilin signal peptidase PulO-like enzyme (type II secretory pathway)
MPITLTIILAIALAAATAIDIRSHHLPDLITLPLVVIGFAANAIVGSVSALPLYVIGAILGFLSLWGIATFYRRFTGRAGIGLGDAKLLAAAGAWMGSLYLAPIVFLGALLGLIAVGFLRVAGHPISSQTIIPFGPFLSAAFFGLWCAKLAGLI